MADIGETLEAKERKDLEEFANRIKQNGVGAIVEDLKRKLDAWQSIALDIGVVGATGVGKSTFINTLRSLKPSDPGAAATDVVQATMEPTPYEHPQNPSVKIWDLPGVGTAEFPRKTYLEQIQFRRFDFYIIICCSRFTEDDAWFAKQVKEADKRFYFVRTKVDHDVRDSREDYPEGHSVENVLSKMRRNCTVELTKAGFVDPPVFLVCKNSLLYDFAALQAQLLADLPELKREAVLLTFRSTNKKFIEGKTAALKKRSWMVAVASAAVALIPVPGISAAVDTGILLAELTFYKKQYGLDDEGIKRHSILANTDEESLIDGISDNFWFNLQVGTMLRACGVLGIGMTIEEGLKMLPIPILSSVASSVLSLTTTKLFLLDAIQSMEQAALNVAQRVSSLASSGERRYFRSAPTKHHDNAFN